MDKTYCQTAILYLPGCYKPTLTYEPRPIPPFGARPLLLQGKVVKVVGNDGIETGFWPDGYILRKRCSTQELRAFYPKPLISDVFHNKSDGTFYNFHPNGAVTRHKENNVYHWSAELFDDSVTHGAIFSSHVCGTETVFDDECVGDCDPSLSRNCSKSCLCEC